MNTALGKMFFTILAAFAEFEAGLLRLRTREGMAVARAKGKLKGRQAVRASIRCSVTEPGSSSNSTRFMSPGSDR